MLARFTAFLIRKSVSWVTGVQRVWLTEDTQPTQCIYYANHASHIDFILLWASLPKALRQKTRPVAAAEYWEKNDLRRFLIHRVFHGITVHRTGHQKKYALDAIKKALEEGESIIFFPEGTRNLQEDCHLLPFKSGLYHLVNHFPHIACVPVWITNLNRVMPKGALIPLPLLSQVTFGCPLNVSSLVKKEFLTYASQQLLALQQKDINNAS